MSRPIQIGIEEYRDKVLACWLGKNIGGTLGAPYECHKTVQSLTFSDPLPDKSAPNDDLALQLAWLKCLEDRGIHITCGDLADYWVKHLSSYPWNEYGFCRRNLERGLRPPISGCFENYYIDEMGSPIRSEIWAFVAPGNPALAAQLAKCDAELDHGGVSVEIECFLAAAAAAAFLTSDLDRALAEGLSILPPASRVRSVLDRSRDICSRYPEPHDAWRILIREFGDRDASKAITNLAITVTRWHLWVSFFVILCPMIRCFWKRCPLPDSHPWA